MHDGIRGRRLRSRRLRKFPDLQHAALISDQQRPGTQPRHRRYLSISPEQHVLYTLACEGSSPPHKHPESDLSASIARCQRLMIYPLNRTD